ncbi:hypothetical protein CXG81DRAFT_23804 [Caulochytrium protostelioides]|uniref:NADH:ubiquinone oxidoreductase intermediate-associated protein 30 domain-containing protein n=1 Tax=Caulochytrium protostelioides TaxID=1555241 RepID=A0A4P9XDJ8_9FUNG|nr:hypothetical protein CXG81DRAFT_23804 [Caulochytrium protostelioides]|eukprot:RKP03543.1 hypothetical protein CXG81DRAFT_23804 [Caulochytrium protostelioides]
MRSISLLKDYFHRSYNHVYRQSLAAIDLDMAWKKEMPMFTFRNEADLSEFRIGSDADIGGYTEAFWGLTPEQTALFWGTLSTKLPPQTPGLPNIAASGYAGVQSRERPLTMLHHPRYDTTLFRYLAIRARGDERQWFVNLQADSLFPTHLWQHRLYFKTPGEWETVLIPFRNFVLTNDGYVQKRQIPLDREKIKTVGFSILRQDGPFSLEVDWIKALNTPQTFGDFDVLSPNEYIDEHGHIHQLPDVCLPPMAV